MELINQTPFDHMLFRSSLEDNLTAVSVAVRVNYLLNNGKLTIVNSDKVKLSKQPWISKYGYMESDLIYRRSGVDVSVYGSAYALNPGRTKSMDVRFYHNGKLKKTLKVFGERFWEKNGIGLRISEPEVFTEIPLSLKFSFGGIGNWDGLEIPFSDNPFGKGYYLSKESALSNSLPNLEFKENRIKDWNDYPSPAGFGQFPMCEFRFNRGYAWNENYSLKKMLPELFNAVTSELIFENIEIGDQFEVIGASENKTFKVTVPSHKFIATIRLGEKTFNRPLYIDQIGLIPNENMMFITYRYHFNYKVKKMEKRSVQIKNI